MQIIEIITLFNQNTRTKYNYDNKVWVFSEFADLHKALTIGLDFFVSMSQDLDQIRKDIINFMEFTEIVSKEEYNQASKRKEFITEHDFEGCVYFHSMTKKCVMGFKCKCDKYMDIEEFYKQFEEAIE